MKCSDAISQISDYLLRGAEAGEVAPQAALEHIAGCRACLATLDELGTLWTAVQSPLLAAAAGLLTCDECSEQLPAYVDAQRTGQPLSAHFAQVTRHLQGCPRCQEEYELLLSLVAESEDGLFGPLPALPTSLWQTMTEQVQALVAPLHIQVGKWRATLGEGLATLTSVQPMLQPSMSATASFRGAGHRSVAELVRHIDQWLELPDPEQDLLIRVGTRSSQESQTTIVLHLTSLKSAAPIEQVRVSLRDSNGSLLERIATDADGLVLFERLPVDKYQLSIEQANRQWQINIVVEDATPAA